MSYKALHKTFIALVVSVITLATSVLWILHKYPPQQDIPAIIIIKSEEGPQGERGAQGIPGKRGDKGDDGTGFWGHK